VGRKKNKSLKEHKKIGIYFTAGSNWLGGVYYLVNLVNSFNYLPSEEKERTSFVVFYNDVSERLVKIDTIDAKKAFLKSLILRKNYFLPNEIKASKIDGLYPFNDFPVSSDNGAKLVSWYPDLQHRYYPEYFEKFKLWQREVRLKKLLKNGQYLVLSSQDVNSHFINWYADSRIPKQVLPFVSLTDDTHWVAKEELINKYSISGDYFMVSNQFYKHKDHKTLLEAIAKVKASGKQISVVMTGKMEDYRDPSYIDTLKKIITNNKISNNVKLLGVIPRNEQLSLMRYATAVIQPSLFEGWSTVVEDVKSIGGAIIASDIEIHKEQLGEQGVLFEHTNSEDLADKMIKVSKDPNLAATSFDYQNHIETFARSFKELF